MGYSKGGKVMLSTALRILDATEESIHSDEIMNMAADLYHNRLEMTNELFGKFLFIYSSALAARVADKVALACLSESDYNQMSEVVNEMDDLTDDILREDRENGE